MVNSAHAELQNYDISRNTGETVKLCNIPTSLHGTANKVAVIYIIFTA